jgi:hypothetical protein
LNSLSDEQVKELTLTLAEIHEQLVCVLDHNAMCFLKRMALFKRPINGIENSAENLYDIIQDLKLSCNQDFRAIVADCVQSVTAAHSADHVGRM